MELIESLSTSRNEEKRPLVPYGFPASRAVNVATSPRAVDDGESDNRRAAANLLNVSGGQSVNSGDELSELT